MARNKIIHLIWPPLVIYIGYVLTKLAGFDNLTSMANDSVHYLVMARHYSPWQSESAAIATAWLDQDFPPFFPWVLAISGAAHSLIYAHILVVIFGLSSLLLLYHLASRWESKQPWIIFPVFIFALSPGFLFGLQGILSESLFLFLSLLFMLLYNKKEDIRWESYILPILLLTAILLTRTIGIALCLAILAQSFFTSISHRKIYYQAAILVTTTILLYLVIMAIWGPVKESHYLGILIRYLTGEDLYQIGTSTEHSFSLTSQLISLRNSWTTFWIIYWRGDGISPSYFIIMTILLASLSGLLIRLIKNHHDAWYVLFYLLILLVWPHPGQMVRLLFPVMPFLLIYAGYAVKKIIITTGFDKHQNITIFIFYLFSLVAILPSNEFILSRANMAIEKEMIPVYEIFRRADVDTAMQDLLIQNQILQDFSHLKTTVSDQAKTMYFLPAYLAILSDRKGVAAPAPIDGYTYRKIAESNKVSYIFLTHLHPRNTRPDFSGLSGAELLKSGTNTVWCSKMIDGTIASCLYKIKKPVLN